MPSPRFPIPQGTLDMLILQILSLEPAHGYGIAQRLDQISRSVVQVNQGSLYPALHRLEQKAWLRAEWKESETGREAKFYSLTPVGRRQLAVERDSWARLSGAVNYRKCTGARRGASAYARHMPKPTVWLVCFDPGRALLSHRRSACVKLMRHRSCATSRFHSAGGR